MQTLDQHLSFISNNSRRDLNSSHQRPASLLVQSSKSALAARIPRVHRIGYGKRVQIFWKCGEECSRFLRTFGYPRTTYKGPITTMCCSFLPTLARNTRDGERTMSKYLTPTSQCGSRVTLACRGNHMKTPFSGQ